MLSLCIFESKLFAGPISISFTRCMMSSHLHPLTFFIFVFVSHHQSSFLLQTRRKQTKQPIMVRYLQAAACLLTTTVVSMVNAHDDTDSWSYLDISIPTSLSDHSVATMMNDDARIIVLTGGCDSPNGNEYVVFDDGEGFDCTSITAKVSLGGGGPKIVACFFRWRPVQRPTFDC
jgi:hypothetical protein